MKHRDVAVILATGGMGLVRAAYSSGKPAYGVGPGQRALLHRASRRPRRRPPATSCSARRSTTACSARRRTPSSSTKRWPKRRARQFVSAGRVLPERRPRWTRSRRCSSRRSGCRIPRWSASRRRSSPSKWASPFRPATRVLIAPLDGVGRDYPLSIEKLCPVLSWYVVKDWREGCERCIQILRYGGMGHTMSIHSQNDDVILQFGLKKPAFRICVNTPTTHGSIGLTTGLDPAMTLGCGGWGGNITSDNISPRHLLNIKRLAYEVRPAGRDRAATVSSARQAAGRPPLRRRRQAAAGRGISAQALAARIDSSWRQGVTVGFCRPGRSRPHGRAGNAAAAAPTSRPNSSARTMSGRR